MSNQEPHKPELSDTTLSDIFPELDRIVLDTPEKVHNFMHSLAEHLVKHAKFSTFIYAEFDSPTPEHPDQSDSMVFQSGSPSTAIRKTLQYVKNIGRAQEVLMHKLFDKAKNGSPDDLVELLRLMPSFLSSQKPDSDSDIDLEELKGEDDVDGL